MIGMKNVIIIAIAEKGRRYRAQAGPEGVAPNAASFGFNHTKTGKVRRILLPDRFQSLDRRELGKDYAKGPIRLGP